MKKVFFLNSSNIWGGGEKWTLEVAQALHNKSYQVTIGTQQSSRLWEESSRVGISLHKVSVSGATSVLNPIKLLPFISNLKRLGIDVLFLNQSNDLKFGGLAGYRARTPKIVYRRGSAIPIKDRFYTRFLLGRCVTDIIANSNFTKHTILQNTAHYLAEDKIHVIYNGIKLHEIEAAKNSDVNINEEFNVIRDKVIIGNVGRLDKEKDHNTLLEAAGILKKDFHNFVLLIIGSGPLYEDLQQKTKKFGLQNHVIFTGFRRDVYSLIAGIDFLVHTAKWEGFGYVLAEAMALGKPVVSTNFSNTDEIVVDGNTGFLAEPENPEDVARQLLRMIQYEGRESLGRAGRERVKKLFTFDRMIQEIEENYLTCTSEN